MDMQQSGKKGRIFQSTDILLLVGVQQTFESNIHQFTELLNG